jgi:glycosidase
MWRFTQALLALRHAHPALATGDYHPIDAGGDLLAYERRLGEARLVVVLNLGDKPQYFAIPEWAEGLSVLLSAQGAKDPALLGPNEGYILG